jgi:hypothetical protein
VPSTFQLRRSYSSVASTPAPTATKPAIMAAAASSADHQYSNLKGVVSLL